jgi:hypothetical protein
MNRAFLWCALFCTVLGLAACGSGSNLAHKLDKLPGKAMLLTEVKEQGITLEAMEKLYPSGLPLFGDSVPAGYMQAWTGFFQGLVGEMRKSGMEWSEPYRFWGRAYFASGGTVDYFFLSMGRQSGWQSVGGMGWTVPCCAGMLSRYFLFRVSDERAFCPVWKCGT